MNQPPFQFGHESLEQLQTCDLRLQEIAKQAIKLIDFTVLEGYRDPKRQQKLYEDGKSKKKAGDSRHNVYPSLAFDLAPYPIDFQYLPQFYYLAGIIMATAARLGIKLKYGGDWNNDGKLKDNTFNDLGHFEIIDDI